MGAGFASSDYPNGRNRSAIAIRKNMERPAAETTSDRVCAKQEGFCGRNNGSSRFWRNEASLKPDDGKCLPGDPAVRVELHWSLDPVEFATEPMKRRI